MSQPSPRNIAPAGCAELRRGILGKGEGQQARSINGAAGRLVARRVGDQKSPAREGAAPLRHRQTHECNSTVGCLRALATLNQQKPTGSPELGRSPFWDRPSRALPDPEEMPASDPSRPPVGPTVNDVPASPLLVPYIISRQARGERKASAGSQAGRSGQGTQANLRRTGPVPRTMPG